MGVLYPESGDNKAAAEGKITSGNAVPLSLFLNHELMPQRPRPTKEEITAFFSNPEFKNYTSIVLSSEFIAYFDVDKMKWLAELIASQGFELKLVYYVRSIADHAVSVYSQIVKRHLYKQPFRFYIEKEYTPPFLEVIEKMHAVVGKEQMLVLNYDVLKKQIFTHFTQNILSCDPAAKFDDFSNQQINRSLDMYELELCRHFNQSFTQEKYSTFISDALIYADQQKKATFVVEPEEVEILRGRFAVMLGKINVHLAADHQLTITSPGLKTEKRQNIILSEYEKNLVNILSSLVRMGIK